MRSHLTAVALGGLLVFAGYWLGSQQASLTAEAEGQVVAIRGAQNEDIFASGRPALITTSADGLKLHLWTFSNSPEQINNIAAPKYVGTIKAEKQ
jgi:hypothetical protein